MKMSKSVADYLENSGWSSAKFLDHAKYVFAHIDTNKIDVRIGRTTIHLIYGDILIKLYVHRNGMSKEFLTITDENGIDIEIIHYSAITPEDLLSIIYKHLNYDK